MANVRFYGVLPDRQLKNRNCVRLSVFENGPHGNNKCWKGRQCKTFAEVVSLTTEPVKVKNHCINHTGLPTKNF